MPSRENPEPSDDLTADYRWIKDRLSADSLDTWGLSSLTREYKWLRGQSTSLNLPEAVLTENPATAEAVAMEIVDRNVLQGQPMSTLAPMTHQVQKQAKEFLYAERYSEAAALFEFMCAQGWMPETLCHNNRGFCLIPVDPRGGLRFLQRAASRGFSPFAVNTHNQMCCMLALDDPGALRDVAERYWCEHFEDGEAISATLWARKGDRWVLTHTPDARECIATLALDVAQREAWSELNDGNSDWRSCGSAATSDRRLATCATLTASSCVNEETSADKYRRLRHSRGMLTSFNAIVRGEIVADRATT